MYAKLTTERGAVAVTARMLAWKQPFIQRVRNSSLVERPCVDDERASSVPPKPWIGRMTSGRGAFRFRRIRVVRRGGGPGKANVGMSNENPGGKPGHR